MNDLESTYNTENGEDKVSGNNISVKRRRVDTLYVKMSTSELTDVPRFTNHKYFSSFAINEKFEKVDCAQRYLSLPKNLNDLNISLDGGYEGSKLLDYSDMSEESDHVKCKKQKLDCFLKCILENEYLKKSTENEKLTFVATAGNISKILITPFEKHEDWIIHVFRVNNLVFIDKVASPSLDKFKSDLTRSTGKVPNNRGLYHGAKFCQLFVAQSKEHVRPDLWRCFKNKEVHWYEEKQYHAFQCDFGNHPFLSLYELRALDPKDESKVEFKLVKYESNQDFRDYKTLQTWGKCAVAGIQKVVCGKRQYVKGSKGFLKEIKMYTIEELESVGGLWSPDACYNFLDRLLNFIAENVTSDFQMYKFTWKLGENEISFDKFDGESFIPSWFSQTVKA